MILRSRSMMGRRAVAWRAPASWIVLAAMATAIPWPEGSAADGRMPEPVRSLIAAERALMDDVARAGAREAFIDRLAAMAVLFRPRAVAALAWLKENPPPEGAWTWRPEFVEISGAGDLGYTAGSWRIAPPDSAAPRAGHYAAIWRWHQQTGWKLLLHIATEGAESAPAPDSTAFAVGPRQILFPHDSLAAVRQALTGADSALGEVASKSGLSAAYASVLAPDARRYRSGADPAIGAAAALAALPSAQAGARWEPIGRRVAESGDLGYTYGTFTRTPESNGAPNEMAYVHIWRLTPAGERRLALDIAIPVPARE